MEPDGDSPPIWSSPSTPFVPVRRRFRLSSVLNPATFTIAFFVLILIIFFSLPPSLSRNNQVLKPNSSVKKSWNSINIFLVLFAVLCGVFARRNEETSSSYGAEEGAAVLIPLTSVSGADWLESPDRKAYAKMSSYVNTGGNRLRRSSCSFPDLRQESLWGSDGEKFKSFDDFEVDFHRPPGNSHRYVRQSHEVERDVVAETPVREIPVDKFELKNSVPPPPTPTQPVLQVTQPPPPPPPPVKRRRSVHTVAKQYNVDRGGREAELNEKRSSETPPPPPPPPELKFHPLREKSKAKKSGATKELATAIVSLYQGTQGKRKREGKRRDLYESAAQNFSPPTIPAPSSSIPSVPPPPPPPPPTKKVLQNFFKKSSKSKRVHSVSTANPPPPPPPPPPQSSIFNNIFKTGSKSKRFQLISASSQSPPPPPPPPPSTIFNSLFKNGTKSRRLKYIENPPPPPPPPPLPTTARTRPKNSPASTGKPPKPTKPSTSHHESMAIAPASPLIPMPPPPPPPPFPMPKLKFITKGDFVRISSANSSRCSSPGREDFDVMSVKSDGGDSIGPSFNCPSPDVDSKADTFISKLRDEWRLEKINSLRNTGSWSARLG